MIAMNTFKINFLILATLLVTLFASCAETETTPPIKNGSSLTITNTLQADATTNGVETPIETVFNAPQGSLAATAVVSDAVEFPAYLVGLYDIDISENSIAFELVAPANDPTYSNFFRILEAGTTDRYYLTFTEDQNISGFSSDNSSVKLRMDSDKVVVVEIGEGFNFNPGSKFTITLN